jgi:hypothetical protein
MNPAPPVITTFMLRKSSRCHAAAEKQYSGSRGRLRRI